MVDLGMVFPITFAASGDSPDCGINEIPGLTGSLSTLWLLISAEAATTTYEITDRRRCYAYSYRLGETFLMRLSSTYLDAFSPDIGWGKADFQALPLSSPLPCLRQEPQIETGRSKSHHRPTSVGWLLRTCLGCCLAEKVRLRDGEAK